MTETLDWERLFDCLRAETRRRLLVALLECDPQEHVVASDALQPTDRDPSEIHIELKHIHLPKLADAGYITRGSDPYVISRGPRFDAVESVLEALRNNHEDIPSAWL
ncbi:hypothetical protein [Haloarcula marismortui]|uniref:ArsR family transcriptional regulator n=1 Tax=Haloarcula marismortui ATCC 33800 TaxID=662476 RepID=A0A8T8KQJ7_9EURY|nr:hypothetical protein [Haloarcula sinaiiensis]QUJ73793.1 hypothetical protein KDQ40_16340 [Haloarcula sinaiiensis ATCC 33800]